MPEILSVEGKGNSRTSRQSIFSSPWNWFSSLHKFDKFFIIAALLIVVATPFIVSNNQNFNPEAAKGGGGGGGGCHGKNCTPTPPPSTGTCVATPNPAVQWDVVTITGSGFAPNSAPSFSYNGSAGWVNTDATGSFSTTVQAYLIGTNTVVVNGSTSCNFQAVSGTTSGATTNNTLNTFSQTQTGNGAPNGPHFNLNIIGVPKDKTADISSGNRIFVPLQGSCQIKLAEGDYSVIDGNCTDDGSATFQLPNPDPTNSGTTTYSVWARALGKPGGSSSTTTCATDPTTNELYCSVYTVVEIRSKGQSSFTNVTKDLLYIYADVLGTGKVQRYPLFDSTLENYYWQYDNNGLKNMQLRFYQIPTTVP